MEIEALTIFITTNPLLSIALVLVVTGVIAVVCTE